MEKFTKKLRQLPNKPGVYLFKNKQKNVLYVGKAKNLKNRVTSYFHKNNDLSPWKTIMLPQINNFEIIAVQSEADALVLENELIKKFYPRYNILLKDDKSYIYIEITNEPFPRVLAVRRPDFKNGSKFYGPYPSAKSIKIVLRLLHRIFPLRSCRRLTNKPCLEHYMGRCASPCLKKISEKKYQNIINNIINFFEGRSEKILNLTTRKMQTASRHLQFEKAALYRNQTEAINSLKNIIKTPQEYLTAYYATKNINPNLGLQELLNNFHIKELHRIEIFDISNIQGKFAVGSMVVFTNGLPDKKEYRKFKIKTITQSNDVGMIREVITRRLTHREWPKPDLIILDGGLGQLNSVAVMITEQQINVCALAKREEEIYFPNKKTPRRLKPGSQGYYLMQRMRDEAHRFAISYYRLLHKKSIRQ